jgi:hypothetical protein
MVDLDLVAGLGPIPDPTAILGSSSLSSIIRLLLLMKLAGFLNGDAESSGSGQHVSAID